MARVLDRTSYGPRNGPSGRLALALLALACSGGAGPGGAGGVGGTGGAGGAGGAAVSGAGGVTGAGGAGGAPARGGAGGGAADGGGPDEAAGDTGLAEVGAPDAGDAAVAKLVWPNEVSAKNSDPWLVANHTKIDEMHPRFLIIDFANHFTDAQVLARFQLHKEALMEGSRYHGYKNPDAKPFMIWEVFKHVSLKDNPIPAGSPSRNSSKMPRRDGGIDFGKLFTQEYADLYRISDPAAPGPATPGRFMRICDLFNAGMVNDILVAFEKTAPDDNVPEVVEYHQHYDENDVKIAGRFDPFAGNGAWGPGDLTYLRECGRSVRLNFLEMTGNLTNAMEVLGHNFEHIGQRTMPRFYQWFKPFANFDLDTRFTAPFSDWYGVCQYGADCLSYPDQNTVMAPGGLTWKPFNQGCGNAHFPPNGRRHYDKTNPQVVLSTCEHYGLRDGPNGRDTQTPYSVRTLDRWQDHPVARAMPGGAWFLYWWQSWPGYATKAKAPDGTPMKNWWVYLYY